MIRKNRARKGKGREPESEYGGVSSAEPPSPLGRKKCVYPLERGGRGGTAFIRIFFFFFTLFFIYI